MAKWTSTILLLVALVALAAASTTPEVIELSDNNLVSSITADPQATWLVELYVPRRNYLFQDRSNPNSLPFCC